MCGYRHYPPVHIFCKSCKNNADTNEDLDLILMPISTKFYINDTYVKLLANDVDNLSIELLLQFFNIQKVKTATNRFFGCQNKQNPHVNENLFNLNSDLVEDDYWKDLKLSIIELDENNIMVQDWCVWHKIENINFRLNITDEKLEKEIEELEKDEHYSFFNSEGFYPDINYKEWIPFMCKDNGGLLYNASKSSKYWNKIAIVCESHINSTLMKNFIITDLTFDEITIIKNNKDIWGALFNITSLFIKNVLL